ncbi:hypothetical protein INT43_009070 [Umbelopsis isabellina]|uniref:NodB homology domain-containing protein n=1 Tax=Mortierella isabellina TaxID=91625 RepID=A0A8H7PD08_MORIS|nr:hypothetical protein INT43_009070 [Umbelopsis isabellina]
MKFSSVLAVIGPIMAFSSTLVLAQGEAENIAVPKKAEWTAQVNMAAVPKIPVRPIGSGVCANPKCDGTDNDKCFESCGNSPTSEDIYGCPAAKQWSLTFDDGPSNYTRELLDMLDKTNIKVTFCVMGAHVKQFPDIVKRAYDSGHQIASHTYSHPHLMSLSNEEIIAEMKATEEAIVDAIGVKPKYMRPPFGEADERVKGLMKAMGYKILLWNADPTDYNIYKEPNAGSKIQATFHSAVTGVDTGLNLHDDPGFISLQHDLYAESIAEVPNIIKLLQESQFQLMTSAQCIGDSYPYQGEAPNAAAAPAAPVAPASDDAYNAAAVNGTVNASDVSSSAAPLSTGLDALSSSKAAASAAPTSKKIAHKESGASMTSVSLLLGIFSVFSAAFNLL